MGEEKQTPQHFNRSIQIFFGLWQVDVPEMSCLSEIDCWNMFYELTFAFYTLWGIEVINLHLHSIMIGISLLSIYLLCYLMSLLLAHTMWKRFPNLSHIGIILVSLKALVLGSQPQQLRYRIHLECDLSIRVFLKVPMLMNRKDFKTLPHFDIFSLNFWEVVSIQVL